MAASGSELHEIPPDQRDELHRLFDLAWKIQTRLVAINMLAGQEDPRRRTDKSAVVRPKFTDQQLIHMSGHILEKWSKSLRCSSCYRSCAPSKLRAWVRATPCVGPGACERRTANSHSLAAPAAVASSSDDFLDPLGHGGGLDQPDEEEEDAPPLEPAPVQQAPPSQKPFTAAIIQPTEQQPLEFGKRLIHVSHKLGWIRGVLICWKCGYWSTGVPRKLYDMCEPQTKGFGHDSLSRIKRGLTPRSSMKDWPMSQGTPPPAHLAGLIVHGA